MNNWKNQRVLVTGACGTVGQELINQLVILEPSKIVGIDNNESELFFLSERYKENPVVDISICDIRERDHLIRLFEDIDIVLHTAALKHVIINEKNPSEAILTNIIGTQNVIEASKVNNVKRVIYTSSDKAVNPTNVMGTSKLMGERLISAANSFKQGMPIFSSTRFGNVMGSNGSVIPIFKQQIGNGKPITITDEGMTRFIMTLKEASSLVMESVFLAKGGEVFVTKMPTIRIIDLADAMISELSPNRPIYKQIIGAKPGEKLYEELMNEEEVRRTLELEKYFVVKPAFQMKSSIYNYDGVISESLDKIYRSDKELLMSVEELSNYLKSNQLL
ncbi:MAG: polysaccharide biosynthesis protein [Cyclobacteriaceae bacterium]|nr:polysaccharide biosynthesis protein [Cyclobacteriaceae bacterium HetDA_MAG_MS6]